jgi:hypothetical protein
MIVRTGLPMQRRPRNKDRRAIHRGMPTRPSEDVSENLRQASAPANAPGLFLDLAPNRYYPIRFGSQSFSQVRSDAGSVFDHYATTMTHQDGDRAGRARSRPSLPTTRRNVTSARWTNQAPDRRRLSMKWCGCREMKSSTGLFSRCYSSALPPSRNLDLAARRDLSSHAPAERRLDGLNALPRRHRRLRHRHPRQASTFHREHCDGGAACSHPSHDTQRRPPRSLIGRCLLRELAGTFFVAVLIAKRIIVGPEQLAAASLAQGWQTTLIYAAPAGSSSRPLADLPNARDSEFWVIS